MENPFTSLEIQLIRSSLDTRTDDQIAELLERSAEEVRAMINEITGGQADERDRDVKLYIQEKANSKKPKRGLAVAIEKKIAAVSKQKREKIEMNDIAADRNKKRLEAERQWAQQRKQTEMRDDRRKFKTRERDYTKCIQVKLDEKTIVYVEQQKTKEETNRLIESVKFNFNLRKNKALYIKEES